MHKFAYTHSHGRILWNATKCQRSPNSNSKWAMFDFFFYFSWLKMIWKLQQKQFQNQLENCHLFKRISKTTKTRKRTAQLAHSHPLSSIQEAKWKNYLFASSLSSSPPSSTNSIFTTEKEPKENDNEEWEEASNS